MSESTPPMEYPALFVAADHASITGRRTYVRLVYAELGLLAASAGIAALGTLPILALSQTTTYIGVALVLVPALLARLANGDGSHNKDWFDGRAVAETVKTSTWRFATRATPYDTPDGEAEREFLKSLREILEARSEIRHELSGLPPDAQQITATMRAVRALPFAERKEYYLRERLISQVEWYSRKARSHHRSASRWFWAGLGFEGGALALVVVLIAVPVSDAWVGLFSTVAASATAWLQLGRYDELYRSYGLAAQELILFKSTVQLADDDAELAEAVVETESAVSREHTMWMAKRG